MDGIKNIDGIKPQGRGFYLPGKPLWWGVGAVLVLLIALPLWVVGLFVGFVGGWLTRKWWASRGCE